MEGRVKRAPPKPTLQRMPEGSAGLRMIQPRPARPLERLPLSNAQRQLWFLEQLRPGLPTYNIPLALRLIGELDVRTFEDALSHIVARHEVLRSTYGEQDGAPFQVVGPPVHVTLTPTDLRGLPVQARDTKVARLAAEEANRPFDLTRDLMVRARLLRTEHAAHVLLLSMHHIASDGLSTRILIRELVALYETFRQGLPSPLAPLELQYGDFVLWQRHRLLTDGVLERRLEYWRRHLAGLSDLDMPTDRPRPPNPSSAGGQVRRALPAELLPSLRSLARAERATLFMLLLAAFKVVLHRYSGQDDVTVGASVSGRSHPQLEPLIGLFVNMLVLRTDVSGDPTFRELVHRVRDVVLDAVDNQEVPFERLVEELRPERDPGRNPLFQISFAVDENPLEPVTGAGLRLKPCQLQTRTSRFDLQVVVSCRSNSSSVDVEYSTELFDRERIERLLDHFEMALWAVTRDLTQRVSSLPLLTAAERRSLADERMRTVAPFPADRCVHHLIERQALGRPRSAAVRCEGIELSYERLNARADRLAAVLRSYGVGPEKPVGVLLDRSVGAVVALLGILKAGGAYVPLEPSYPVRRVHHLLADTGATVVVSDQRLAGQLPPETTVVRVDGGGVVATQAARAQAPPRAEVHPDNLAYVLYTSGSTGQPKGVMVSHRSVVNFATQFSRTYAVEPTSRVLQSASLTFDHSVLEVFVPLVAGATVCIAPDRIMRSPQRLAAFLRDEAITIAGLPPAVMALMPVGPYPALRVLSVGGEPFPGTLVNAWNLPGRRFFNAYGPTEATVIVAAYESPHEVHRDSPPIGRAAPNHRIHVLDRYGNPAPVGVPGELYLGGVGLARGYQGRPGLTAERFVPDPLSQVAGERLYRTGDIGCYLPDGAIRFLRRADDQLKIRGIRIEPGEIEAVLARHPQVQQVAVVGREEVPGDRRLVAYLVVEGEPPTVERLRQWVAAELPDYMVPSAFVVLDALPRTRSGKVDRRALPSPGGARANLGQAYVAPRTRAEQLLADAIFAEVLKVEQVGVHDSFFDLGGNSLQVPQIVARINDTFAVEIDVSTVYSLQSVARIAELVDRQPRSARVPGGTRQAGQGRRRLPRLVAMQPNGSHAPFFCVHPSGGSAFGYVHLANCFASEQPFFGLEAVGLDGEERPLERVEEMASRYLEAVQELQRTGPYRLGGWSMGGIIAFEMAHQLRERGHSVGLVAMLDTHVPHDGGRRPLHDDLVTMFVDDLIRTLGKQPPALDVAPASMGPEQRLALMASRLDRAGLLPPGVQQAQLQHRLDVFISNVRAFWLYRPRRYPGRINLVHAERSGDLAARWRPYAAGGVASVTVPGDHFSILRPPSVQMVAEALRQSLM
jgi:amino acid adenylation domain-containing protein